MNLCRTVFHLFASPHEAFKAEELTSRRTPLFELTADGMFICKLWDGIYREPFMLELLKFFNQVRVVKPKSCRDASAELYLVCACKDKVL